LLLNRPLNRLLTHRMVMR